MKSKFYGGLFAVALTTLLFNSCKEEVVQGVPYEPIALNTVSFDTIPASSLPSDTLRDMIWSDLYDVKKVDARKPVWFYYDQDGKKVTSVPDPDYATPAVVTQYQAYQAKLAQFEYSKTLIESRKTGVIRVSWEHDAPQTTLDSNMYVEVTYYDHKKKKDMRRNATSYLQADGKYRGDILIPGTLRTYTHEPDGTLKANPEYYHFKIQPVSPSLKRGPVMEIPNAFSSYFQSYIYYDNVQLIGLSDRNCWLLDKDKNKSEVYGDGDKGKFKNLYDGNPETYFHTDYSDAGKALYPWSILVDAGGAKENIMVKYVTRKDQDNGTPSKATLFAYSNDKFDNEVEVVILTTKDPENKLPKGKGVSYSSGSYNVPSGAQYFRFRVDETAEKPGDKFFSLAEFQLASAKPLLMDPERNPEDRY